jgi:hypothetical protein
LDDGGGPRRAKAFVALLLALAALRFVLDASGTRQILPARFAVAVDLTPQHYGRRRPTGCANISLLIPMTPAHLPWTARLLASIANGTRVPCEILISLSSVTTQVPRLAIPSRLREHSSVWLFPTRRTLRAAQNRNRLASLASMPLLASLDSDDLQGRMRLASIEHVFRQHPTLAFMLQQWFWCAQGEPAAARQGLPTEDDLLPIHPLVPPDRRVSSAAMATRTCCHSQQRPPWANGHIVVRRDVWKTVRQNESLRRGEGSRFTGDLLLGGYQGVFVNRPLTGYCHEVRPRINLHIDRLDRYYRLNGLSRKAAWLAN